MNLMAGRRERPGAATRPPQDAVPQDVAPEPGATRDVAAEGGMSQAGAPHNARDARGDAPDVRDDDRDAHERTLPPDHTQAILEATKHVAAVLKTSGCPFALIGSVAAYAHGIPVRLQHDADFAVRREDAPAVTRLLEEHGVRIVDPPEDWLVKARSHGEQIDLIFALAGRPVTTELLDRAQTLPVDSVHMPVLDPTDLLSSRLAALSEHHCDFGALLPVARGLRERVDWDRLRRENGESPMAAAFLYLLELLDVIDGPESGDGEEDDAP
jgi:hypothetical protein